MTIASDGDRLAFQSAIVGLRRIYQGLSGHPGLAETFRLWRRCVGVANGAGVGDEALFLQHTYLATLSKLVAAMGLGPPFAPNDMEGVLLGEYFQKRAGLLHFAEEDLFTWFLFLPSPGWNRGPQPANREGLEMAWRLAQAIGAPGAASLSYQALAQLHEEARAGKRVEMPVVRLHEAVRLKREALEREGVPPGEIVSRVLESVAGVDADPLAVCVARAGYALALGDLLQHSLGEAAMPVYLSNGAMPVVAEAVPGGRTVYVMQADARGFALRVPEALAHNAEGLDYLLPFMRNKYGRSVLGIHRSGSTPEALRVWGAFHQFLVTPETSRKPFVLDEADAQVMMETHKTLVRLMLEGRDGPWLYLLRNALGAAYLKRRRFDAAMGQG